MSEEQDEKWADNQDEKMKEGAMLVQKASSEALDYTMHLIENIHDKQWRRMVVEKHAIEMGAGKTLALGVIPLQYKQLHKKLHRKLGMSKSKAEPIVDVYMGRLISNLVKELHDKDK